MEQEQQCDSNDSPMLKRTDYAVRIPTSYSQEEIEAITNKYLSQGWRSVDSSLTIGFVSPDGGWFTGFDAPPRVVCYFTIQQAIRLGLCVEQEKVLSKEVQVQE